jgi:deaminated glutathione amidase
MIVDPWGMVLATCPDRDGHALANFDLDYLDRLRTEFLAFANRRPEAYGCNPREGARAALEGQP